MSTQGIVTLHRPQPAPLPISAPARLLGSTLLPALATGGLLWLCHFPVAWGWLGWVALVPLLTLVRSKARPSTVYLCAWAGGLLFFWPALQWMRVADFRMYFTWAFLATYCSLFFPVGLYLIRLLQQRSRLPFIVAVPVVWTALEFFRSFAGTGFSWYLLAHTQHDQPRVIQIADITGAWGVSFLVVTVNAFLCQGILGWQGRPVTSRRGLVIGGILLTIALAGVLIYGGIRSEQAQFKPGPVVALVQGNLPQYLKNNPTTTDSIAAHYIELSDMAARQKPDLIVWPETSMPQPWREEWPTGPDSDTRELCKGIGRRFKVPVLLGLNSGVLGPDKNFRLHNSAALVDARGEPIARYDKIHRVPFGEYVPLRDWLPFMNWFAPYDFEYSVSPGIGATRFPLGAADADGKKLTFGVVICYEDTDPDTTRPDAGGDGRPPADFLLNISNDGWFEGTSEHEEHLAICRFRAVECRRAVARSVNMGISAVIDSNGQVLAPQPLSHEEVASGVGSKTVTATLWRTKLDSPALPQSKWGDFKKVSGIILATVPLDTRSSFYARVGDWLPWTCWGVLGICIVRPRR